MRQRNTLILIAVLSISIPIGYKILSAKKIEGQASKDGVNFSIDECPYPKPQSGLEAPKAASTSTSNS